MRNTLVIEVSGQMLQMTLMVPAATGHPLVRLGKALLGSQESKKADTVQLIGAVDAKSIRARLEQALEALGKRSLHPLKASDVRVALGANFSRVAVIEDPRCTDRKLSAAGLQAHVQTWAAWNWGVVSNGILSHASLGGDRLLVSIVANDMFDALEAFCKDKKLCLVDCRPAVLSSLESPPSQFASTGFDVLAVQEACDGLSAPLVQFIARNKGEVLSIHRMCLPGASRDDIQGVAQRLLAHHAQSAPQTAMHFADAQGPVLVRDVQWPAPTQGGARG